MKILITTDWYAPVVNGVVTSVLNLQTWLGRLGHDVRVLTLKSPKDSHAQDQDTVWRIPSISAGRIYPNARLALLPWGHIMKEIEDWGPDIIHTQCEFSTFFYARHLAKKLNIPIVHTYHTIYEDYTHYFSPSAVWGRRLVRAFSRAICGKAAQVIVPSRKVADILEEYGVITPISVIPSGIDLDKFAQGETQAIQHRLELGIQPGQRVCVYVGRMAKEKNLKELLRFFAHTAPENAVLLMVGGGPYLRELEYYAQDLDMGSRVIFTGEVAPEDVAGYYKCGDVFLCASTSETQGMTYAEALACGLPLLCRRDRCLEGVIYDGENGWEYETQSQFAEYLAAILEDETRRLDMGLVSRQIAQDFSAKVFAAKVHGVYLRAR